MTRRAWWATWREASQAAGVSLSHEAPLRQGSQGDWFTCGSWASSKRLEGTSLNLLLRHSRVKSQGVALFTSWPDSSPSAKNQVILLGEILVIFSSLLFFSKEAGKLGFMWHLLIFQSRELIPIVEILSGQTSNICGSILALRVPFYDLCWGQMFGEGWDKVGQGIC